MASSASAASEASACAQCLLRRFPCTVAETDIKNGLREQKYDATSGGGLVDSFIDKSRRIITARLVNLEVTAHAYRTYILQRTMALCPSADPKNNKKTMR